MGRIYMCIDLKSFYASVECVARGLDPLTTNLVVADKSRTEKTICLAVSPSLKQYGIPGRARLFEVVQKVKEINFDRRKNNKYYKFSAKSFNDIELKKNKSLELDYIVAQPRMRSYMKTSVNIYNIYLKYIAKEDICVYSIDEVFCDITNYLKYYNKTPKELVTMIIKDVYDTTGITATAGVGTNMYLAKVAMDIVAKHADPNEFGVRYAEIDEEAYKRLLWEHKPITSFWRVGAGFAKRLETLGCYTMGDVARLSITNEDILFKTFGINAELLIDHAWGYEPVTMKDIKSYKPTTNSLSTGQVLHEPYTFIKARLVVSEMVDSLVLDLVEKNLITNQLVLTIGYDIENLTNPEIKNRYHGDITMDHYGRFVPKHAHGTVNLEYKTASTKVITDAVLNLYDRIVNDMLLVRRINIAACNVVDKKYSDEPLKKIEQCNLFTDYDKLEQEKEKNKIKEKEEIELNKALLEIKNKYGKNAILKGMNFLEGATQMSRNTEVGGHHG